MSGWSLFPDSVENWVSADNVFTEDECKKIIADNEKYLEPASINIGMVDTTIRNSSTHFLLPSEENAWVFGRLTDIINQVNKEFFNFDLSGMSEGLQFTKYTAPGGFYEKHIDRAMHKIVRKLSLTIQLSNPDDYEGGDLLLHLANKPIVMEKSLGKVIIFPSYTLHEVTPVTKGTRYSLVAWITGNPFK